MRITVLSALPDLITNYCQEALLGRAQREALVEINAVSLREFSDPPHYQIDDRPFGGGAGMLLRVEPIAKALQSMAKPNWKILLSAKGRSFQQEDAKRFAQLSHLVLICGRYEGVDQRVADHLVDEEVRVGDFVTMGGEPAALAILEAVVRLIPGALGNEESLAEESFSESEDSSLEYPQYTRPREFQGLKVPEVLVSGDHQAIRLWRESQKKKS
ncbi:MAG: tRNA (guanosine(37)-N1)-methyltransferase TrmD [Bradymonadales bacterium]|nr:MAG: tRNA (guanosine(37)-N1)-methyltransferase TrmD [Bradymonadales bacterium]